MARPFPNTFDNDSPLSPPQSAGGGNAPISYRTNVNRQKTTKWTQAKAVDYGGDDWGSDDEYDLPPPQVIKKPTGLRQQGQGLPSQSQGNSPAIDYGRKAYGPLAGGPTASNPRGRTNSFGADEERSFSSTAIPQQSPSSGGPATRFSQITGLPSTRHASGPPALSVAIQSPTTGLRKPSQSQALPALAESPLPDISGPSSLPALAESPLPDIPGPSSEPASAATSQTPVSDYQASRDFSPSAVPQPLSTRTSPAPSSPEAVRDRSQSTTTFPARKSSLSQSTGPPDLTNPMQSSQESAPPRPWTAGRSSSPAETPRTPGTPGKKLPFIRPADIYKRAEEERQSMESGRPSMDSIMGTRGNERGESPARLASRERTDSLGSRTRSSVDDEGSESGRRLMPMLDTVKERKSEYGFEGFNVNDHAEPANQGQTAHEPTQSSHLSEPSLEVLRSHSTSPKLPDLNRMSSFGMDMFSPSRTDDENPRKSETATPPPASEITLHSKPSIGLRSAVHQAFDRSDGSSVPPTPASRTGSGVRRTDSESTGTTGISPIMSRVPSTAIPNTQNRDFSTPAIPEAIDEPVSPDRSKPRVPASKTIPLTQPQPVVPGFKPGHRRDISAPSPGNSPARTPNVETTIISPPAHEVMITDASPTEQSRPLAEREQSFRPIIPGGWTSYAASSKGDAVEQEVHGGDVVKSDPVNEPYPIPHDDYHDLTPTSTRGTAQIPLDRDNSLPTPDPAMAPSGNLYSKAPLDPRLLPKLEQVPIETQLRPDVVHGALSAQSSAAPTPPPKDTPLQPEGSSSYFPHKDVTVNQKPGETLESSGQTQALPTFAADDEFPEDENDRLREEIVKTLTPRQSTIGVDTSTLSAQPNELTQTGLDRDSAYLPSEYDNYWQSSADDEKPVPAAVLSSKDDVVLKPSARPDPTPVMDEASRFIDSETPTIPPLKTRRISQQLLESKPNTLQHRFSWEKSTETVPDMGSSATNTGPEPEHNEADHVAPAPALRHSDHSGLILDERPISDSTSHSSSAQDHHTGTDAALITGGAGTIAAAITTPPSHPDRRQSLADEKDHRVSPNNFTPTPPESDHSATSPGAQVSPAELHVSPTTAQFPPIGPHGGQHERLMAFKEIAALKSQQERTQAFNATRQRYAAMDSGLSTWIEAIQAQHPEHADAAGWGNISRYSASGTSSARSKFAKVTGSGAPSTQQPYYQQYLNASSPTTPTASSSRPGLSTQSSGQQGFSPASAKLTTQQVQAKGKELGKELFHTAGIFGGKAGKAGKGLLAKGKSRFRGSGGGDKISIPSKKPERRSSWGPLLTLSRSPGHHESAHQASNILVTVAEHPITPNMQRRASSPHFSNIDHANRARRDIPTTNDLVPRKESFSSSEVIQESQATPKMEIDEPPGAFPVSKGQAFEDPFTSTPIAEKETFQSQDIPNSQIIQPSVSEHHDNPLGQLSPRESDLATSPRSSGDTRFYSVPEGSPDLNEWVVVSPAHDTSYFAPLQESNESHVDDLSRQSTARAENVEERSMVSLQPDHDNLDSLGEPNPNHPFTGSLDPEVTALPSNTAASELIPEDTTATVSPELGNSDSVRSIALMGSHQDAVSPESDLNDTPLSGQPNAPSVNITSMSILNRPRGNTIEDPLASSSRSPVHYTLSSNVGYASSQPAVLKTPRERQQEQSNSSFLPPIRRTSTFGIGFGSRQKQRRFPIDDDDEHITGNEQPQQQTGIEYATSPGSVTPREYGIDTPLQQQDASIMQQAYVAHSSPTKPRVVRVGSSDYSQHKAPQQPNSQQFAAHRPYDVQPRPTNNSRHSQDSRRANGNSVDMTQAQRNAPWAGSNLQNRPFEQPPSSAQRYPGLFRSDTGSEMPDREHDLPAHYYQQPIAREEAFLPRQQISEYEIPGVGPPTDLPQTGSSRNSGRFFRELSGRLSRGTSRERNGSNSRGGSVSSPQRPIESNGNGNVESSMILEEGKGQSSRRANLFGNLERASTVALGNLQSRESVSAHHSGLRTDLLSSGQESPIQDQKKRSFFGSSSTSQTKLKTSKLSRSSTSGMLDGPGKKRRFSGLTGFFGKAENSAPRSSMPPPTRSPGSRQFGYNERPVDQPSQSSRFISNDGLQNWTARKQGSPPNQETPVRGRRGPSRSGGLLSKLTSNSSSGMQESQISDGSQKENKSRGRRPSTSGLLNGIIGRKAQPYERDGEESRSQGSQPRTAALPLAQTYTDMEEQQPLEQIRQYHQSRPHTTEQSYQARGRDRHVIREPQYDSVPIPGGYSLVRPQGAMVVPTSYDPKGLRSSLRSDTGFRSQSSSPPQQFPPQQSYSSPDNSKDDYNEYPQHSQDKQHGNAIYDARSSQSNRSLRQRRTSEVNLGSQYHQQEPRFEQVPSQQEHKLKVNDQSQPLRSLAPLETSQTHSPRYLSSEEELACSPAKTPEDQQRPYQISLPGSSDTEHRPAPIEKDHIYDSHNTKPSRNSIQRLQHGQPVLQHPASPAEYPIPDSALSPVNPQARDFPPPPPPTGWESQSSYLNPRYQPPNSPLSSHHNANLSVDLERSNTRRTAVSAVSQVSHMSGNDEPPRGRSSISAADEKDLGGNVSAESSRGPSSRDSPVMSPEGFVSSVSAAPDNSRGRSGERGILREHGTGDNIPTTTLNHNPIPDDLYDASPPLPNQGLTLLSRTTPKPSPIQTSFDNTQIHPQNAPISNTHLAPNDHLQNKQTSFPEEKIHYNSHSHSRTGSETRYHEMDAEPTVTMSATSYPGQEWNPYAGYEGLD